MATQLEVAEHLDLSTRRVRDLVKVGKLPVRGKSGWDLDACRLAYIRDLRQIAAGHRSQDGILDLTAERARLASEQADLISLKAAETRGDLLRRGDVVGRWQELFLMCKEKLRAIPSTARRRLRKLNRKDEKMLLEVVDQALQGLATDGLPRS